jgi:hypothetical protein
MPGKSGFLWTEFAFRQSDLGTALKRFMHVSLKSQQTLISLVGQASLDYFFGHELAPGAKI